MVRFLLLVWIKSCINSFLASHALFHNSATSGVRARAQGIVERVPLEVSTYSALSKAREEVQSEMMALSHRLQLTLRHFDVLDTERVRLERLLFDLEQHPTASTSGTSSTTSTDEAATNAMVIDVTDDDEKVT